MSKDGLPWDKVFKVTGERDEYVQPKFDEGHINNFDDCIDGRFVPEAQARKLWKSGNWLETSMGPMTERERWMTELGEMRRLLDNKHEENARLRKALKED